MVWRVWREDLAGKVWGIGNPGFSATRFGGGEEGWSDFLSLDPRRVGLVLWEGWSGSLFRDCFENLSLGVGLSSGT